MTTMTSNSKEIDFVLEQVLCCQNEMEYDRTIRRLASSMDWGEPDCRNKRDGDPINRMLWGLCTRASEYSGPYAPGRVKRSGPFTYTERMFVRWAAKTESEYAAERRPERPTAAYIANILQRSDKEVMAVWLEVGPAQGREGFGLE